jgi:hypothetical protein
VYVKDTKFERQQHEATGRHQGNIQRSLRGLHREQENEQRNKARAQAEVARLNGLVPSSSSATPSAATGSGGAPTFEKRTEKKATLEDRKKQWEQLAALGVTLPDQARGDLAIAGDWKTVSHEIIGEVNEDGEFKASSLNKGVHKRKLDEQEEQDKAAGELITKRKGWGHTYKSFPGSKGGEDDIESLLLKRKPQNDIAEAVKEEPGLKKEEQKEEDAGVTLQDIPTAEEAAAQAAEADVKKEQDAPAVVFKKRKKVAK